MEQKHFLKITDELSLTIRQVEATAKLLEEESTVPFIARYRKEATGSLDEIQVTAIRDMLQRLRELDKRRNAILKSMTDRGLLTDELREKFIAADNMSILEDIYLPFRPKRRTRAMVAKEKGLEPLAKLILEQRGIDPEKEAGRYVDKEKGVESIQDALHGARDIIAELVNEDSIVRAKIRNLFFEKGTIKSKVSPGREEEAVKYKDYFEWEEPVRTAPSHRVLAMRRGEKELSLSLSILPDEKEALNILEDCFIKGEGLDAEQVKQAVHDGYRRLLSLTMETEVRLKSKKRADEEAVRVFAENLRQLLLSPPLGQKIVMGIDPGFRTGCKVVCLDRQGKLLHNDTIYIEQSEKRTREAADKTRRLCDQFGIEVIAVGNGTAGRETERFLRALSLGSVEIVMVSENGASVYSASETAREEFPEYDLTVRGSVSIGRRLMDPLAELVKIDPKSIGVGQYQHDVDQKLLRLKLDDVVASCVNMVGVELNTASREILTYVSGLGPRLAGAIVKHRNQNGPFGSRKDLMQVSGLGPKAFQQSAGFLRICDGNNPLDAGAVHPESYPVVVAMAEDLGCQVADLIENADTRKDINLKKYVNSEVGLPTLNDIMAELDKPGRDPREKFEAFCFAEDIDSIDDLLPGQQLPGIVTNITNFGAFVDIGVHQDGLVHISQMADRFVKDPSKIVKLHQKVMVTVLETDPARKRISLSLKACPVIENK